MKSSTLFALAALSLLAAQPAMSQPNFLPPPDGGPLEELNLSSDQQAQIQQIVKSSHERSRPLLQQLRQISQQTRKQIEAVLTTEQREQLKQLRAEHSGQVP